MQKQLNITFLLTQLHLQAIKFEIAKQIYYENFSI